MSINSIRQIAGLRNAALLYGLCGVFGVYNTTAADLDLTRASTPQETWHLNVGELLDSSEIDELEASGAVISGPENLESGITQRSIEHSPEHPTPMSSLDDPEHGVAAASLDIDPVAAQLIASYQHTVDQLLDSGSAYDPRLAEVYYDMASMLQQFGDLDSALKAYEQSMYIARINNGLYSVSQAPMLRGIASCLESLQQWEEASDHYRHLLWLHQQTLGGENPQIIPLLGEVSAWYLKAYNNHPNRPGSYLSESERLTRLGLYLTDHENHTDLNDTVALLRNLAAGQYLWAQHLRRNPPLESGFEFASHNTTANRIRASSELDMMINTSYRVGRSAFEKQIELLSLHPYTPPEEVAVAIAELGDWHMRYGHQSAAHDSYRNAYDYLSQHRGQSTAAAFFAHPSLIQPLWPVNHNINVIADLTVDSRGRATVLEVQQIEDEALRARIQRYLRVARFRPSLQNGEPETAPYRLAQSIAIQ